MAIRSEIMAIRTRGIETSDGVMIQHTTQDTQIHIGDQDALDAGMDSAIDLADWPAIDAWVRARIAESEAEK